MDLYPQKLSHTHRFSQLYTVITVTLLFIGQLNLVNAGLGKNDIFLHATDFKLRPLAGNIAYPL